MRFRIITHDPSHHNCHSHEDGILYIPGEDERQQNLYNYRSRNGNTDTNIVDSTEATTLIVADVNLATPALALRCIGNSPNLQQLDCRLTHLDFDYDTLVELDEEREHRRLFLDGLLFTQLPSNLQVLKFDQNYVANHAAQIASLLRKPDLKLQRLGLSLDFSLINNPSRNSMVDLAAAVSEHTSISALEIGVPGEKCRYFQCFCDHLLDACEHTSEIDFSLSHLCLWADSGGLPPGIEQILMRLPHMRAFRSMKTMELRYFTFCPDDVTYICQFLYGFLHKPPVLGLYHNKFIMGGDSGDRDNIATVHGFNRIKLAYDRLPGIQVDNSGNDIVLPELKGYTFSVDGIKPQRPVDVFWNRPACDDASKGLVLLDNLADLKLAEVGNIHASTESTLLFNYAYDMLRNYPSIVSGGLSDP